MFTAMIKWHINHIKNGLQEATLTQKLEFFKGYSSRIKQNSEWKIKYTVYKIMKFFMGSLK